MYRVFKNNSTCLPTFALRIIYLLLWSVCLVARYVLGHDAMRKMGKSNVLISGLKGLGVEVGKLLHVDNMFAMPLSD